MNTVNKILEWAHIIALKNITLDGEVVEYPCAVCSAVRGILVGVLLGGVLGALVW